MKFSGLTFLTCLTLLLPATGARALSLEKDIERARNLMKQWRYEDAGKAVRRLRSLAPEKPEVLFLSGLNAFYFGNYKQAHKFLRRAVAKSPKRLSWRRWLKRVSATREVTRDYLRSSTPDNPFVIYHHNGPDAILAPYLLEALKAAHKALAKDLNLKQESKVRVEIYPNAKVLASVSPLTEKEIESSGTIALCKYNRLMITSPRALLQGYRYLHTVAHEYVHFLLGRLSHNRVPLWLHEGLAKLFETRWQGPPRMKLSISQETLLAKALRKKDLITFEQMHPSIAKLPTQEKASLAFAEVLSAVQFILRTWGLKGINAIITQLRKGKTLEQVWRQVTGHGLARFQRLWVKHLSTLKLKEHPRLTLHKLSFRRRSRKKKAALDEIKEEKARKFTHLGELLRGRGRVKASILEYRKAVALAGTAFPVIHNKLAAAYLSIRDFKSVIKTLEALSPLYPHHINIHTHLGAAHLGAKNLDQALTHYRAANRINPFDPRTHIALNKLYGDRGESRRARLEKRALDILHSGKVEQKDPYIYKEEKEK